MCSSDLEHETVAGCQSLQVGRQGPQGRHVLEQARQPGRPLQGNGLVERVLGGLLDAPERPFVAVLGGSKVSDKLGVIDALLERCDTILVGGAMAFTFLAAQGRPVGDSLLEADRVEDCRRLLATGRVEVPVDVVIAQEIAEDADHEVVGAGAIPDGWKGLDVGPETAAIFADQIGRAHV